MYTTQIVSHAWAWLYLPRSECICMDLIVPVWVYLDLTVPIHTTWIVPAWTYLDLTVPAWICLDLHGPYLTVPASTKVDYFPGSYLTFP